VKFNRRPFKTCKNKTLKFEGSIYTNGFSVTTLLQSAPTRAGQKRKVAKVSGQGICEPYVEDLPQSQIQNILGRCVYIDPNRRDLLYCCHHRSTSKKDGLILRYTQQQRQREIGSKRMRRQMYKPNDIRREEVLLSHANSRSCIVDAFIQYLHISGSSFHNRCTYYEEISHRRRRFNIMRNEQISEDRFINQLKDKYGHDAVLIVGNYSMPNMRFQKPAKGKGLLSLMKKRGFEVYRIDEFRSSSYCPSCQGKVRPFLRVPNPRPYQRVQRPTIFCHGLLKCGDCGRKWNRDLLATLNFRYIVSTLAESGHRPALFTRRSQIIRA
jgi:transposase